MRHAPTCLGFDSSRATGHLNTRSTPRPRRRHSGLAASDWLANGRAGANGWTRADADRAGAGHIGTGRRLALFPEQLVALESDPDSEHDQRCHAHRDRHVDQ